MVNDVDNINSIDKPQENGKITTTRMNFQLKSIELEEFQRIELLSQIETIGDIYIYIVKLILNCILYELIYANM